MTPEDATPAGALLEREIRATGLPLRGLLALALAVHVATALVAVNPVHPDEQFQILEPAFARAGHAPLETLPWEFHERIRSTVQPALAMVPLAVLQRVGVESPFVWTALLKALTLAAAAGVTLLIIARTSPTLTPPGRRMLWLSSLFLWFLPFLRFRFTGENLGGMALAASVILLAGDARGRRNVTAGGALLGLSVVFRFQMGLAALGLLAWLSVHRKAGWPVLARVTAAAALVVAAASLVDAWFYGAWVFTPWRYFQANVLEGVASTFGTSPWHWYLTRVPLWMAPPLSLALVGLLVACLLRRGGSPWVWVSVAFVAGHTLVAHKELRFLFPLVYALPVLLALGADALGDWARRARWRRIAVGVLAAQNVILLGLMASPLPHRGTDVDQHYLRVLWEKAGEAPGQPLWVLHDGPGPYDLRDLSLEVFRHPAVRAIPVEAGAPLASVLPPGATPGRVLYMTTADAPPGPGMSGTGAELLYRAEPAWAPLARAVGGEDTGWLRLLNRLSGWSGSEWARSLYELPVEGG